MRILGGILIIVIALISTTGIFDPKGAEDRTDSKADGDAALDAPALPIMEFGFWTGASDSRSDSGDSVWQGDDPQLADERCFQPDSAAESSIAGATIVVDPGHGGEDLGTVNDQFELTESELVLSISKILRDRLTGGGARVCLTRTSDRNLSLRDRAYLANQWGGDAFVSIHLNRLPDSAQNYSMTMWGNEAKDGYLAEILLSEMAEELATPETYAGDPNPMSPEVVRMEHLDSSMLRGAEMPAVLVEASFLSNWWEAQAFLGGIEEGSRWREHQIADAVHRGLAGYFDAVN